MNRTLQKPWPWPLRWLCIAFLYLGVVACGKSDESVKTTTPAAVNGASPKETVFDDLVAAKARAKKQADEATVHDKEKLDAAMKQAEESGATPP